MTYWDNKAGKYRECDCEPCGSNPFKPPKYGQDHAAACVCSSCVTTYNEHNKKLTCPCADCAMHQAAIYPPAPKRVKRTPTRESKSMATINLCERCGTMAKSSAMGGVQSWDEPNTTMAPPKELCPGCVGDFHKFMEGETVTVGDRPNAYHKPWEEPKSADPLGAVSTQDLAAAFLARQATEAAKELEQ